jgi:L-ribulokinase
VIILSKYSIGIDFGTLSGRAVLVNIDSGEEVASESYNYPHGVMDKLLPDGVTKLQPETALQDPQDYLDVLANTIPKLIEKTGVSKENIIGVGIDFTSCTILPVDKEGTPLCFHKDLKSNPHAYVKLWKHHAAQYEADKLNRIATERGETFLNRYGGKISSEWVVPKVMQILDEAPDIYEIADRIMEAADWIVLMLTGEEKRSSCNAGYKAIWSKREGYPSSEFFAALDPRMKNFVDDKLNRNIFSTVSRAGGVTAKAAALTGLKEGTSVAVGNIDAHVALPAAGITGPDKMLMIMGTSTCHIMMSKEEKMVHGVGGVVEDGVLPGYFAYEAGQACVGDHFQWFVENCMPSAYHEEAKQRGISIYKILQEKADRLRPGQSGLIALDWWNGNRSILTNANLSGMILGCTLVTKPEDIYRALIEATAYGTRVIIEEFEKSGVPVKELYAAGGISQKDALVMQIYADITKREIRIADCENSCALGAAIFGTVAAGSARGGVDAIEDAAGKMGKLKQLSYQPKEENSIIYDKLYAEYKTIHDYFGCGQNDVMKRLKQLRNEVLATI